MGKEFGTSHVTPLFGARLLVVGSDGSRLAQLARRLERVGGSLLTRDTFEEALLDLDDHLPDVVVAFEPPAEFTRALAASSDEPALVVADESDLLTAQAVGAALAARRARDEDLMFDGAPRPVSHHRPEAR